MFVFLLLSGGSGFWVIFLSLSLLSFYKHWDWQLWKRKKNEALTWVRGQTCYQNTEWRGSDDNTKKVTTFSPKHAITPLNLCKGKSCYVYINVWLVGPLWSFSLPICYVTLLCDITSDYNLSWGWVLMSQCLSHSKSSYLPRKLYLFHFYQTWIKVCKPCECIPWKCFVAELSM